MHRLRGSKHFPFNHLKVLTAEPRGAYAHLIDSYHICEFVSVVRGYTAPVLGSTEKYGCPCRIL